MRPLQTPNNSRVEPLILVPPQSHRRQISYSEAMRLLLSGQYEIRRGASEVLGAHGSLGKSLALPNTVRESTSNGWQQYVNLLLDTLDAKLDRQLLTHKNVKQDSRKSGDPQVHHTNWYHSWII